MTVTATAEILIEQVVTFTQNENQLLSMASTPGGTSGSEGSWAKLVTLPGLVLTSIIAILLLVSDRTRWTETGPLYRVVAGNRASIQIIVQILANCFGAIHVHTICVLINFSTRLRLARKAFKMDRLKFWNALCTKSLDLALPLRLLLPLIMFLLLVLVPGAVWAGALTPVATSATISLSLKQPQYSSASSGLWSNLRWTEPMLSKWAGSVFTYSPNYDLQGLMLNDAASSSNIGNKTRVHRKLDNTGYSFFGRSYGIGASVGLVDQAKNATVILGYQFNETGYLSDVKCVVNATSNWALTGPVYTSTNTYPNLYLASGNLTNGNPERYSACGLGSSDGIFALVGSQVEGENSFAIAAGKSFAAFDKVQCRVTFTPTLFSVKVNATDGLITVSPVSGSINNQAAVHDIEPTGAITTFAMRIPTSISQQHACDLYTSLVGTTFVQNIRNVQPEFQANATSTSSVLRGVEDSIASMLDNSLLAFASAQLMIANDTISTPVTVSVRAVRIGEPIYIYIIAGLHFTIVLLFSFEIVRTKMWQGLSNFDYTDVKSVIVGTSIGGTEIAERARDLPDQRQGLRSRRSRRRQTSRERETVVGDIKVKLKLGDRHVGLVGPRAWSSESTVTTSLV